jgi:hypothetical protein
VRTYYRSDVKPVTRTVALDCRIEPLPNGSRLHVTSEPTNETFHLEVMVELQSPIGSASESFSEEMAGVVYDYGDEFEARRIRCLVDLSDAGRRFATYEVLPDPDGWRKIPSIRRVEFESYLGVLAHLKSQEDPSLGSAVLVSASRGCPASSQRHRKETTSFTFPARRPGVHR